jgi:hypothetical protein
MPLHSHKRSKELVLGKQLSPTAVRLTPRLPALNEQQGTVMGWQLLQLLPVTLQLVGALMLALTPLPRRRQREEWAVALAVQQ